MKKIAVLGLLVLAVMASMLVGCTDEELTQEEIEQFVADVMTANAEIVTCKLNIHTLTTFNEIGGAKPGGGTITGDGTGAIDNANGKLQMLINMTINVPDKAEQNMPVEYYLVGGWMHIKMSIPEKGEQWIKMKMPDELWDEQSQLDQQIELLETAKEVNFLGVEEVSGTACYVVEIVPGTEVLNKLLSQVKMPEIEGVDPLELNLSDLLKEMSLKEWIAKDSYLFMKSENRIVMEILPGDVGATEEDFEKITMNTVSEIEFYDYNEAVSIELPAEALEAPEMPVS